MPQLAIGERAPGFTLTRSDGSPVSLSDYAGRRVIVFFYPAALTPACAKQACDFEDSLAALAMGGLSVLGISPDPPAILAKFAEEDSLTYPLLSDPEREVIDGWGAWGEKQNYGRVYLGVIRSTVVIAPDGTVELARYNVKATGHVAMLRKLLGLGATSA